MPRYVLVMTKASKKPDSGKVVAYDKNGKIALFHRSYKLSGELKPKQLVLCQVITERESFYILKPLLVITDGRIPRKYDLGLEVWGRQPHEEIKRQRLKRRSIKQ